MTELSIRNRWFIVSQVLLVGLRHLVRIQAASHPAVIGSPIGRCTFDPGLAGVDRHCK
jgi:hypothetical protein